jgi:hypothetical protein
MMVLKGCIGRAQHPSSTPAPSLNSSERLCSSIWGGEGGLVAQTHALCPCPCPQEFGRPHGQHPLHGQEPPCASQHSPIGRNCLIKNFLIGLLRTRSTNKPVGARSVPQAATQRRGASRDVACPQTIEFCVAASEQRSSGCRPGELAPERTPALPPWRLSSSWARSRRVVVDGLDDQTFMGRDRVCRWVLHDRPTRRRRRRLDATPEACPSLL